MDALQALSSRIKSFPGSVKQLSKHKHSSSNSVSTTKNVEPNSQPPVEPIPLPPLPMELVACILDHLDDEKTLHNLLFVSSFTAEAERRIYRDPKIYYPGLIPFFRQIVERPRVAAYIRVLMLANVSLMPMEEESQYWELVYAALPLMITLQVLDLQFRAAPAPFAGRPPLVLSPNLHKLRCGKGVIESLVTGNKVTHLHFMCLDILGSSIRSNTILPSITTLWLHYIDSLDTINLVFPNLDYLEGVPRFPLPRNVNELDSVRPFRQFEHLRTLRIHWGATNSVIHRPQPHHLLSEICKNLFYVGRSLEVVAITAGGEGWKMERDQPLKEDTSFSRADWMEW